MQYECVAETLDEKTRCRNFVEVKIITCRGIGYFEEEEELMCSQHRTMKRNGKKVNIAPRPDIILIKFKLNPNWAERLKGAGIHIVAVQKTVKDALHAGHAREHRRSPYKFREVADSGTPVFGAGGLQNVSISGLWLELLMQGYRVIDTHILDSQERMKTWVTSLALQNGEQEPIGFPNEVYEFLGSCFGHCHVWANPPNEEEKVVHTLNMSHRQDDTKTEVELRFNKGLWAAVPFARSK